jgi:hypothetical protein
VALYFELISYENRREYRLDMLDKYIFIVERETGTGAGGLTHSVESL